jgi:glucose-6-phosphate 1-dehydrogenase
MSDTTQRPLSIIIFGATGDLAQKKLIPALLDLFEGGYLPTHTRIVGFSRRDWKDADFQHFAREVILRQNREHSGSEIEKFLSMLCYVSGDMEDPASYRALSDYLRERDASGTCSNKLFYLAVPPSLYLSIFENLSGAGLSAPCVGAGSGEEWVRLAVEKPFGKDLDTAQALDTRLCELFSEEQIFRIDHYLAKEEVENILAFRFSNEIFEPIWSKDHIESVRIRFLEDFGIGTRGSFYDGVGALRDVGQNHMLQMLALIAMEDPGQLDADSVRKAREDVLGSLMELSQEALETHTLKGQYATYREEKNVAPNSKTDTYFRLTAFLDTQRWQGVPFILEGGKMLNEHRIDISVKFKKIDSCVCTLPENSQPGGNEMVFTMHPEETIAITFWAKKRGFGMAVEPRKFEFEYDENGAARKLDAYERLIWDVIQGDQTLFTSGREVENSWKFITPIVSAWANREPHIYEDNSTIHV